MVPNASANAVSGLRQVGRLSAALLATCLLLLAPAAARNPSVSAAAVADSSTPQGLVLALQSTPLAASELPIGFSQISDAQDVSSEAAGLAGGLVGAVLIPVSGGSSAFAALGYGVFDTAADASAAFNTNLSLVPQLQISSSSVPSGFDGPAMLYNGSIGGFGGIGASACATLAGSVVVVGISAEFLSSQGSPDDACALAHAAVAHLATVAGG